MWLKFLPHIAIAALAFLGGLTFQSKVLAPKIPACPPAPPCICPPTTAVDLQSFSADKIKGIRTFTYSPSISGTILIVTDSITYKKLMENRK